MATRGSVTSPCAYVSVSLFFPRSSLCLTSAFPPCPRPPDPPPFFHHRSEPYWFLRLWMMMAERCLPWDNWTIIGAVMSASLPPAYLFINVMCHLLHAQEGEAGGLNNGGASHHRLVCVCVCVCGVCVCVCAGRCFGVNMQCPNTYL